LTYALHSSARLNAAALAVAGVETQSASQRPAPEGPTTKSVELGYRRHDLLVTDASQRLAVPSTTVNCVSPPPPPIGQRKAFHIQFGVTRFRFSFQRISDAAKGQITGHGFQDTGSEYGVISMLLQVTVPAEPGAGVCMKVNVREAAPGVRLPIPLF
jgi:hypothetical protein